MKIINGTGIVVADKKRLPEKELASKQPVNTQNAGEKPLSFMSIPKMAFLGKLVIPTLPKNVDPGRKPEIRKEPKLTEMGDQPVVEYKVYPQDPLITKPENYIMKGEVSPGPENNRIKTVDKSDPAKPNEKGNYIYDTTKPEFDRVNSFLFANKTLKMYEEALGRKVDWAFNDEAINIQPRAGEKMNAYYSRWEKQIKLFYFQNRFDNTERCYTSKMADVITHETGHAVLDGLKPDYIQGWGGNGRAIHEGFSDSTAMLVTLWNDNMIDKLIKDTKGNLRKENIVASLGEQFGKAVYGNKLYLRNAINNLKQSDFDSGKESTEEHNYGRLYGAMFYDIICDTAALHGKTMGQKEALMKTREDLTKLLARAMGDFAPAGEASFKDIGKALLQADKTDFDSKYKELIQNVLLKREILKPEDIKQWESAQAKLPELILPPNSLDSTENLKGYLNSNKKVLGLPKENNYELQGAYTNNFGETFVNYKAVKELPVKYNNEEFVINMHEGVTLGFNKEGKLFYVGENKITSDEIKEAKADVKKQLGKIKSLQDKGLPVGEPRLYRLPGIKSNVLIKVPKLEDPVG